MENDIKISELYKTAISNRIREEDIKNLKQPIEISDIKIVGKTRKGILLEFEEIPLLHKCNKEDIRYLAEKFNAKTARDFINKKITLVSDKEGTVRIKQV